MTLHVILGKGPIGTTTAAQLLAAGDEVRIVSRSGRPEKGDASTAGAQHVAADAADAAHLVRATQGADVLYNCANPAYHRWLTDWPPVAEALLAAAEAHDAILVTAANLYVYGPTNGPMTETTPMSSTLPKSQVRADMWREAQRRHLAGRVRATEVRASDYIGPRALVTSHVGERLISPLLAGRTIRPIGNADAPHTWTYLPDLAAALVAAGRTESAWGHAWHVPSPEPRSFREVADIFAVAARRAGPVPEPRVSAIPLWAIAAAGAAVPMMREIHKIGYQFSRSFVMDSTASQHALGLSPTSWKAIASETLDWWYAAQPV
ncbi:NAD-dependent epimerase/dehydratase family protein [Sanguibacter antarcticus]|uniref:Nucleoside-diphosphate-sugar epimerase n=1 Tax=Sanguibacter antarcticus TaxID=372484 RepID=A0A2A9E6T1_9MICO|nr:NAD-dependent epimerase/dehydratase family protein [Sanguibacter antarcticus]PFG33890.1 nucleoside-diphosphate-sugar epimerase [Sanguibacter antarcticus]